MIENLRQRPGSSSEEQRMDAEAIRNLRSFIVILQEWDREAEVELKATQSCRLIQSGFTSHRESDMS